ncbi:hypothetical protein [Nocardia sp. NPDC005978]
MNRPTGTGWQLYVFPGSRASTWLRRAFRVGAVAFGCTIVLLTIAVLS